MKPTKKKPVVKVNRITIARLYNKGNYEHVRYELSADVPKEASAKDTLVGLLKILNALNPKCPHSLCRLEELDRQLHWKEEEQKQYFGDKWQEAVEARKAEYTLLNHDIQTWRDERYEALKKVDDVTGSAPDLDDTPF